MARENHLAQLASAAGVSIATVSRVLNQHRNVSDETRQKVLAALQFSSGVTEASAPLIGLIVALERHETWQPLLRQLDQEARRFGARTATMFAGNQPGEWQQTVRLLERQGATGLILIAPENGIRPACDCPLVVFNNYHLWQETPSVDLDLEQAAVAMADHLTVTHGFRSFGIISGLPGCRELKLRADAFANELKQRDLLVSPALRAEGDGSILSGFYAAMRILSGSERPQAIFAADDRMALGALNALERQRFQTDGIAIAGCGETYPGQVLRHELTTLHLPWLEIAQDLFRLLRRENRTPDQVVKVSLGLVPGTSCGCSRFHS